MNKTLLLFFLFFNHVSFASEQHMIGSLGKSPKGQFVAIEEYGYRPHTHTYYVQIRVMNVWKKQYVPNRINVELPAERPFMLEKARSQARSLAKTFLAQFYIN